MKAFLRTLLPTGILASAALLGFGGGCSSGDSTENGAGQNLTEATTGPACDVIDVQSGSQLEAADLKAKHNDAVSNLLLTTPGCPKSLDEIMAKLAQVDTAGCKEPRVETRLISEPAMSTNQPQPSYRTVTARQCGGRQKFDLLFSSHAGANGTDDKQGGPSFVEVIARDTDGVYNFYSEEGGQWRVFGKGTDAMQTGYDCKNGACVPKLPSQTAFRCLACHPGGGLNMKELQSPWAFWDQGNMPGAQDVFRKGGATLGARELGVSLEEEIVEPGNVAWVPKRIAAAKRASLTEVLRPVFCTIDMNLNSAFRTELTGLPFSFFTDESFAADPVFPIDPNDYQSLLADPSIQQTTKFGKRDTPFPFIFPRRSFQDTSYQRELIQERIVDFDFVFDVLNIDFTRPIYSTARCDLLQFAPTLDEASMTPANIKAGFIQKLAGATGAGATLLANLQDPNDGPKHLAEARAFTAACLARVNKDKDSARSVTKDAILWATHLRHVVEGVQDEKGEGIIEFPGVTLPDDQAADVSGFDAECVLH